MRDLVVERAMNDSERYYMRWRASLVPGVDAAPHRCACCGAHLPSASEIDDRAHGIEVTEMVTPNMMVVLLLCGSLYCWSQCSRIATSKAIAILERMSR